MKRLHSVGNELLAFMPLGCGKPARPGEILAFMDIPPHQIKDSSN